MNTNLIDTKLESIIATAKGNEFLSCGHMQLAPGCVIEGVGYNSHEGRGVIATCTLRSSKVSVKRLIHFGPRNIVDITWDAAKVREWERAIIDDVFLSLPEHAQLAFAQIFSTISTLLSKGLKSLACELINSLSTPVGLEHINTALTSVKKGLLFCLA